MSDVILGRSAVDSQMRHCPDGELAACALVTPKMGLPPLAETCAALKELQSQRRFCIRLQSKCDRSTDAFVARRLGYHSGLDAAERKKLFAEAGRLRRQVERGGDDQVGGVAPRSSVIAAVSPLIILSAQAREAFDLYRVEVEKDMRRRARALPVWPWVNGVRGFSDLGLGMIVGEAGDLSSYTKVPGKPGAGVAKLWKRLGLAVIGGVRQGGLPRSAGAAEWIVHGYNRERRSEIWVIADVLLRAQWRGEREGAAAHAIGPYGEMYGRKKAEYVSREGWSAGHADAAARRYMAKCLVRDLWCEWRVAE